MFILVASSAFLATLAGGAFAYYFREKLNVAMSFAAGVLIGLVFMDFVPELFEVAHEYEMDVHLLMSTLLAGFISVFLLEKLTILHSERAHDEPGHRHNVGVAGALGLTLHEFLDGIAIGLAFQTDATLGVMVLIAVIAHDFTDGLNTMIFVLASKQRPKLAWLMLLLNAIAPILGAALSFYISLPDGVIAYLLAYFAGFFLYFGASDMLPYVHRKPNWRLIVLTILGIVISSMVIILAHSPHAH